VARILAAGQDLFSLDSVIAVASGDGHEVATAFTGLDAYETAIAQSPDLIILEAAMPVFNGYETCLMLRNDPEIPEALPIILMTPERIDAKKMEYIKATDQLPKLHQSVEFHDMMVKYLGDKAAVA